MNEISPHLAYFSILSVIQPACIEDIEKGVAELLGAEHIDRLVNRKWLRRVHDIAQYNGEVINLGNEKYFIAEWARVYAQNEIAGKSVDNLRLFMIKHRRKKDKRGK